MNKTFFANLAVLCICMGFLLGIYNGRIGVWKDQDPTPYRVIPCPVFLLSPSQREKLAKGIRIDTMEDLEDLFDNFLP